MDTATGLAIGTLGTSVIGFLSLVVTQHNQAREARESRLDVSRKVETVADVLDKKTTVQNGKLDVIHDLVNDRLTRALDEIKKLRKQLKLTEATVERVRKEPRVRKR